MRSRCSKIHPDSTYELSEDNSEANRFDILALKSQMLAAKSYFQVSVGKEGICVIIQDEIDSISMRYGIEGELEITE